MKIYNEINGQNSLHAKHTMFFLLQSLLEKIQRDSRESITAAKSLLEKGHLSQDCVLIVDEIYLQKGTQLYSG